MSLHTLEREQQLTVKSLRLRYLDTANQMLAAGNYAGCHEFLTSFADSVPRDSDAYPGLLDIQEECRQYKERKRSEMLDGVRGRILEEGDVEKIGMVSVYRDTLRMYAAACWRLAQQYKLIPSE